MRKRLRTLLRILTQPFRLIWGVLTLPFHSIVRFFRYMDEDVSDRPVVDAFADTVEQPSGLLAHFGDLRKTLLAMLGTVTIFVIISFAFTQKIVDFLAEPIGGISSLVAIDVTESIGVFMRVALLTGFALASPFLAFELWMFASSGLKRKEKITGLISIPLVTILLVCGMAFAYYVLFPNALPFLLNFMGVETIPRPSSYINFVTGLMFWIGVAFEFPLVIYVLTRMGFIKPHDLAKHWRIAVLVIAILAAVVTPTVDPVNMGLVMAPMLLLYIVSIGLSYLGSIGRKKKMAEKNE